MRAFGLVAAFVFAACASGPAVSDSVVAEDVQPFGDAATPDVTDVNVPDRPVPDVPEVEDVPEIPDAPSPADLPETPDIADVAPTLDIEDVPDTGADAGDTADVNKDTCPPDEDDDSLTQKAALGAGEANADDEFASAVAVFGNTAIVGAYKHAGGGAAYVFVRDCGSWMLKQTLAASDAADGDRFGISVGISGETAIVGANGDDDAGPGSGSAYVFIRSAGTWTEQQKLTADDADGGALFGFAVAVSGDRAIAGAIFDSHAGPASGSAYIFERTGEIWGQTQKLTAADAAEEDQFGQAVAIAADTAIVGAHQDSEDDKAQVGSAYVFVHGESGWSQQQKLMAGDAAAGDLFGASVALDGDTTIIGAHHQDAAGSNSGAAYVFVRAEGVWTQQQKLLAGDSAKGDRFGYRVTVLADAALVTAYEHDAGGAKDSGAAYLFVRSDGAWTEQQKLVAADGKSGYRFGYSAGLTPAAAMVGAASGTVYVFE